MITCPVVPTLATAPTKNQLLGQFWAASSERRVSREMVALDPPRGDQQVGVPVGVVAACTLRVTLPFPAVLVWRVDVELRGEALGDEVLLGEGAGQLDPVLDREHRVGR